MHALVVYESMFGNTEHIAESVVDGLSAGVSATIAEAGTMSALPDDPVDLLVVGAPTHAFGLPGPRTREDAARQAPGKAVNGNGVREWLDTLPAAGSGAVAATFDTRLAKPRWLPGSAARRAAARLRRLGYRVVAVETFFVTGTQGPLKNGEAARARLWASNLVSRIENARD
ncbi:flavodoxin family protein [Amycolatopsis sp. CA-230715]|uniref:flavodoxin family protein n=1 Tax=Amycolatopsis sp. CA-230715 TaxID=2745196 RepID=UPI001C013433|nr:flavodoxin domain-containing protein [Amycolatopsis sp. CA-230715]QWF77927.1 hypothetical protein HUW46_01320 [Amycolatopsis sp. CA-230715]